MNMLLDKGTQKVNMFESSRHNIAWFTKSTLWFLISDPSMSLNLLQTFISYEGLSKKRKKQTRKEAVKQM